MLNGIKDQVIAVRGNCEAEVDQMVLEFPCMADYDVLWDPEAENPRHAQQGPGALLHPWTHLGSWHPQLGGPSAKSP
jgi:uncharacterized protein